MRWKPQSAYRCKMEGSTKTREAEAQGSSEDVDKKTINPLWGATAVPTRHLFIANCGPAVGISFGAIEKAFASEEVEVEDVRAAWESRNRVIVSFRKVEDAAAVKEAWSGRPCDLLHGRIMHMQYSRPRPHTVKVGAQCSASTTSAELGIPGLAMHPEFVTIEEEQDLLAAVDSLPWQRLAKRRVQHYGYEFLYKSRNVDLSQKMGSFPAFVEPVVRKISLLPELTSRNETSLPLDQLTVNDYPSGVGLSPHSDTHSAFEGSIMSLSLGGHCVMEFRRYLRHSENPDRRFGNEISEAYCESCPCLSANGISRERMERKALFLPQRSLIVLSDEARYAWHHYIPHHKVDVVAGETISRKARRVSFTFRKVRAGPCKCSFPEDCDSRLSGEASKVQVSNESALKEDTVDIFGGENQTLSQEENCQDQQEPPRKWTVDCDDMEQVNDSALGMDTVESEVFDMHHKEVEQKESTYSYATRDSLPTPEIEKLYVHKVYDAIAPHFSATRFAKWPKVAQFLDSLAPGSLVADSGCGNGKYLGFNPKCFSIGCDISPPLVGICASRGHEALVADALQLPYRTDFFDAAISIAVLHHLSSDRRRLQAIKELLRIVRSGGMVLITVWAREQEDVALIKKWTPLASPFSEEEWVHNQTSRSGRKKQNPSCPLDRISERQGSDHGISGDEPDPRNKRDWQGAASSTGASMAVEAQGGIREAAGNNSEQQEYFVPWHLPYHRAEINGASAAAVASGFARRDEKKGTVVYNRYYHVFAEGELERLVTGIDAAVLVDRFYDKSNWCIILQKL